MPGHTYKSAGHDLDEYDKSIAGILPLVRRTQDRTRVLDDSTGFASLFDLDPNRWLFAKKYRRPVLVTCTDGVGTKLKVAALAGKYDTVGIDLVAMCVNDCICTGGEPLVFLDYLAMPADDPELARQLVKGVSDGCLEAECSLVGGETAVMPGVYAAGDFDMAGFCAGVVERDRVIDGKQIIPGDKVIGLASSGLHSNGYSLVRKVVFESAGLKPGDRPGELGGKTVAEELLTPTRIYARVVKEVVRHYPVKRNVIRGLAHVTGGGIGGNLPRILPAGRRARLTRGSWPEPAVFGWLQRLGGVDPAEMDRVFNMGVGFVAVAAEYFADSIVRQCERLGCPAWVVGEIAEGEPGVEWRD